MKSKPTFAVWALKDPESGNLDRIQIIKGWYENGYPQEKVYDVALSDNRQPDATTGKVPPVGNTVDIANATFTNDIGDTQLSAVWTDPDFKPEHHALYYVRAIQAPTPTINADALRCEDDPAGVCRALISYYITDACGGCHLCVKACPQDAINGVANQMHSIDPTLCDRCGICVAACPEDAIVTI